ncbi:hypothetical protein MUG78_02445 [Gordonia alkaliphila]|uniref:hypothetical protein n=1 Tax=Gordonia alkaliphila TaxID=1053547 RepID=UPI001FF38A9A|nr:hypothetical protein [Gordonia alkaliphila]MCK0438350.1 hypothetical protein [Gordonia alkaliphila]
MSTLEPGQIFAGYTIESLLGAGGMGEVYIARHPRLPRSDALKILSAPLADDDAFRRRFEREADVVAGLSHPTSSKSSTAANTTAASGSPTNASTAPTSPPTPDTAPSTP